MTMKTFGGVKPLATIKDQCKAAGVAFDDFLFRVKSYDYVCLGVASDNWPDGSPFVPTVYTPGHSYVLFNTFNGNFFGHTDKGVKFDSSSSKHEHEPWFQALLSFFYVEKGEPAAPKRSTTVDYTLGGVALLEQGGAAVGSTS